MSKAAAAAAVAWLKAHGDPEFRAGLARYGLPTDKAFGVSVATIQRYARTLDRDHDLARELWRTGWSDARMLASFVGEPAKVTPAEMDAWCRDFDSWGIVDTVCFKLWDRSPHAWRKAGQWTTRKPEFEKRAGFVLMACLAAHDKSAKDDSFLKFLPLIEKGATDDRNFVKKGVSWALRHIGHRNAKLHAAALNTATRLAKSEDATQRWVGKDVLRDLVRPAVIKKVNR
ncbi:MAG TPA: DNA alkylation repair protein [Vicinamibacterales bacterium]